MDRRPSNNSRLPNGLYNNSSNDERSPPSPRPANTPHRPQMNGVRLPNNLYMRGIGFQSQIPQQQHAPQATTTQSAGGAGAGATAAAATAATAAAAAAATPAQPTQRQQEQQQPANRANRATMLRELAQSTESSVTFSNRQTGEVVSFRFPGPPNFTLNNHITTARDDSSTSDTVVMRGSEQATALSVLRREMDDIRTAQGTDMDDVREQLRRIRELQMFAHDYAGMTPFVVIALYTIFIVVLTRWLSS